MSNNNNKTNRLPKTNASSKLGLGRPRAKTTKNKKNQHMRTAETIQRLNMYKSGKPIRNKEGKIVAGSFLMNNQAGDQAITATTGKIAPDRRWFGNTRTVTSADLDNFRQEMTVAKADPYSVVLKRKKLPMGLLQDAAEFKNNNKKAILEQEPFEHAFGKQSRRKRVKVEQLFVSRDKNDGKKTKSQDMKRKEGQAQVVPTVAAKPTETTPDTDDDDDDDDDDQHNKDNPYATLLATAQQSQTTYQDINTSDGMVPWGRDSYLQQDRDWRPEKKDDLFLKGQSKRIWAEFYKVIDCSDVILHVIDARNVPGTRCSMIERHVAQHASHKHLVFVLNKIDLVPNWVAKRWMGELAKSRPTIAFHASLTHAFGKGALISLLRQFATLHQDKKQISVGVIGYPNVGKSSVINTLISKKSCKVAPIPGETKIWQYITLFKRVALIDCPGVVVDTAGDTETDSVLKGVVRAERLSSPEDFIDAIMDNVKAEHIRAQYKLSKDCVWNSSEELLEMVATKCGRLRKGGDACLRSAAIMMINDFQRGRLPHYVAPAELKDDVRATSSDTVAVEDKDVSKDKSDIIKPVEQDLDVIGEEFMKGAGDDADEEDESGSHAEDEADTAEHLIGQGEWDD